MLKAQFNFSGKEGSGELARGNRATVIASGCKKPCSPSGWRNGILIIGRPRANEGLEVRVPRLGAYPLRIPPQVEVGGPRLGSAGQGLPRDRVIREPTRPVLRRLQECQFIS